MCSAEIEQTLLEPMVWPASCHSSQAQSARMDKSSEAQSKKACRPRPNGQKARMNKPSANVGKGNMPAEAPSAMTTFSFKTVASWQSKDDKLLSPAIDSAESLHFLKLVVEALDLYQSQLKRAGLQPHPVLNDLSIALDTVQYENEMQEVLENLWIQCAQLKKETMYEGQLSLRNSNIHDSYGNVQTSGDYAPDDNYEVYDAPPTKKTTWHGNEAPNSPYVQEPRAEVRCAGSGSPCSNSCTARVHFMHPSHSPHAVSQPPPAARAAS